MRAEEGGDVTLVRVITPFVQRGNNGKSRQVDVARRPDWKVIAVGMAER